MYRSRSTHDHIHSGCRAPPPRRSGRLFRPRRMRRRRSGDDVGPETRHDSGERQYGRATSPRTPRRTERGASATARPGPQDVGQGAPEDPSGPGGDGPGQELVDLHRGAVRADGGRLAGRDQLARAQRPQGLDRPPPGGRPPLTHRRLRAHGRGRPAPRPGHEPPVRPLRRLQHRRHGIRGRAAGRLLRLRHRDQLQPPGRAPHRWTGPALSERAGAAASGCTSTTTAPPRAASASGRTT